GVGLGWFATFWAVLLGQLVAWGAPARELLEYGAIDLLVAAMLLLTEVGLLLRFNRVPGFFGWLALTVMAALGWFTHPFLFALLVPLLLIYYLNAGVKHRSLLWHVALWAGQMGALGSNLPWLWEWVHHWWIRSAPPAGAATLHHRTLRTLWEAPLWGTAP